MSLEAELKELKERIAKLESWAHPPKGLKEFGDYIDIDERIKKLEKWQQQESE